MTKVQMLNLVDSQLACYNQRDLEGFCQFYHPEVEVGFLIPGQPGSSGGKIFRERYQKLFALNPLLRCELKNRIIMDTSIIDEELVSGLQAFPAGLHTTAIYGFRDGLIDRVWFAR